MNERIIPHQIQMSHESRTAAAKDTNHKYQNRTNRLKNLIINDLEISIMLDHLVPLFFIFLKNVLKAYEN